MSKSRLWTLQREYFERAGPSAWSESVVPSFVTTNSFVARAYARLAEAYQPRTIVELGAGSGRFAHHFLKHYAGDPRYVMTDVSSANVEAWKAQPKLRAFAEAGALDFALYDPVAGGKLEVDGPVFAIANYVFDGVEHDVYAVKDGALQALAEEAQGDFDHIELEYKPRQAQPYADPDWNSILASYEAVRDGAFIFPTGSMRAVECLRALSGNRLLLVAGDKGRRSLEDFRGQEPPQPMRHGSVSFDVNFHALAEHCRIKGGRVLMTPHKPASLDIQVYLFGAAPRALDEAYESAIVSRGPDEIYTMKKACEKHYQGWTMKQFLGFLRLASWDSTILAGMYDSLFEALPLAGPDEREELAAGLRHSWDNFLPLGEKEDFAFQVGNLLAAMGRYPEALDLFLASRSAYGGEEVEVNIRLCKELLAGER